MRLVLQERKQFYPREDENGNKIYEYYYEYTQLEIESFEWEKNHTFVYSPKNSARVYKLKENQEIVGLGI